MSTLARPVQIQARYRPSPEQIATYHREGWVLLPGLIAPEAAEALREEVMGIMDLIGLPVTALKQTAEYLAGSAIDHLIHDELLGGVASELMGVRAHPYLPFTAVKSPGGGKFSFHQDNQYTRHDGPSINCWFALTPMGEAEGCLRMLPRSHTNGTLEAVVQEDGHRRVTIEPKDFVTVAMQPGDCCAFSRVTVHGSGANTTSAPRVGYACQFHGHDTRWLDGDQWPLLRDKPRFQIGPVAAITRPKGKIDGH